jgi:hypothetical protein
MFRPLPGNPVVVLDQMIDEVERVYSTFLTRVVRRPLALSSAASLPVLIVASDSPVGKSDKPLEHVVVNDGVHLHGVLVVSPRSRLQEPVEEHFRAMQRLYVQDGSRLDRVHVVPVEEDDGPRVAEYALKSVARRRWSLDDVLVLPRSMAEVRDVGGDRRPSVMPSEPVS